MAACRPAFLFEMLDHDDDGNITRKEYDEGFYIDVAIGGVLTSVLMTKVEWGAGWE